MKINFDWKIKALEGDSPVNFLCIFVFFNLKSSNGWDSIMNISS